MNGPINIRALRRAHEAFLSRHDRETLGALSDASEAAIDFVNRKPGFERRTGRTQAKTKTKVLRRRGKTFLLRVNNTAKHAAVLEKGSKRHPITAKPGKALRFWGFGRVYYRKSVMHPGTKPYRFLSRARNRGGIEFERSMRARMIRAARSF